MSLVRLAAPAPRTTRATCAALAALVCACNSGPPSEFYGARLGASAADTRARFIAPAGGTWSSRTEPMPTLEWSAGDAGGDPRKATFEFHQGMLVAERFVVTASSAEAKGPPLESSRAVVLARRPAGEGKVSLTLLSRECPEHQGEVRSLLVGQRAHDPASASTPPPADATKP